MSMTLESSAGWSARQVWRGRHEHPLDHVVGCLSRGSLFTDGWGDARFLATVSNGMPLAVDATAPVVSWESEERSVRGARQDGTFESPYGGLPAGVRRARVRWLRSAGQHARAVCVVLAASRDEGFRLRTWLFAPLLAEGIDLFLLENPFYGSRRPHGQRGAWIRTVSEQVQMNIATVEEARALLAYAEQVGYRQAAVAGYSMGGYMAALTAAATRAPIGVAALAAGASPAPVFTGGAHCRSISFRALGGSSDRVARERLARVLEVASARRFPPPARPTAAVILACARDGFVPISEAEALHAHWPGSELRVVGGAGHLSAIFIEASRLRAAVRDAVDRSGSLSRG
jgi:pimeloyl-ACP methyl ester carboxylesterase